MPILRYKFGQERGIVKENAGFDDSIFPLIPQHFDLTLFIST